MRTTSLLHSAFLLLALVACDSKKAPSPEASTRATPEPVAQASSPSPSPSVATPRPPPLVASAAAAPSASGTPAAPASAAAGTGPCPANAKRYEELKFCVVFPEKMLEVTYEGDANGGNAELEPKSGGVLRFFWAPLARAGNQPLKAEVERVDQGFELVSSGDLPGGGAWSEMKKSGSDEKTQHVIRSAMKTSKLLVECNYSTTAENADKAREVCKSVRAY